MTETLAAPKRARGTSNSNKRGNTRNRRARRQYLLETYAADVNLVRVTWSSGETSIEGYVPIEIYGDMIVASEEVPTTRCYRCGCLLHEGTLTVDRIVPECQGGTYRRTNIRPACGTHNSSEGGKLGAARLAAKRAKRA